MTQQNVAAKVANPFAPQQENKTASSNAVARTDAEKGIQEVMASMMLAKQAPRDPRKAVDRIVDACTRETLAEAAVYEYVRGGAQVTGPSIRLAECIAQNWGNLSFGVRELSSENGVSTVQAYARDLETNTLSEKVFQVPHVRYTRKSGNVKLTDPRDIYELIANNGARRMRNCILAVVPGDVVETAVNQCMVTQEAGCEVTPETVKAMVSAFEKEFGVTSDLIEKRIQRRIESITAPLMLNLKRIFQSLRDGMSKKADWFDVDPNEESVQPKTSDVADATKKQTQQQATKVDPVDEDIDESTGEITQPPPNQGVNASALFSNSN